jgi:hypothetical protein
MRAVSAVARIARVFLAHPDGEPVAMSNAVIADLARTTARNVRRCLTQLRDEGALDVRTSSTYDRNSGTRLLVPNHAALRRVLDEVS